ncbi:MAG: PadR family transcriptional regulator [Nitrososphaerales archaeon]
MSEEELIRNAVKSFSRAIILWLLSKKPLSGYSIIKEIKRLSGQKFHPGVIYPLLYELEKDGLITGEWTRKNGRYIKNYSITDDGEKMLDKLRKIFDMPLKEVLKELIKER